MRCSERWLLEHVGSVGNIELNADGNGTEGYVLVGLDGPDGERSDGGQICGLHGASFAFDVLVLLLERGRRCTREGKHDLGLRLARDGQRSPPEATDEPPIKILLDVFVSSPSWCSSS